MYISAILLGKHFPLGLYLYYTFIQLSIDISYKVIHVRQIGSLTSMYSCLNQYIFPLLKIKLSYGHAMHCERKGREWIRNS